jgi:acetyl-CoA synthetase
MAEHENENVPALPIAARMRDSTRPKPHVGPAMKDYQKAHALTVGKDSDDFWRKVCSPSMYATQANTDMISI